jgi:oligopeptide/dipeptide ABC transporter ATP-binding protein
MGWTEGPRVPLAAIGGAVPDPAHLPSGCSFHPRCPYRDPPRCDARLPELEDTGGGHDVRCLRWREIIEAA